MNIIPTHLNKSRLKTRNKTEAQFLLALETGFMILREELQILDTTFYAQRQKGFGSSDACHAGMYEHRQNNPYTGKEMLPAIKINFRNLMGASLHQFITVLGHEFRHAVQATNKWGRNKTWTGPDMSISETRQSGHKLTYFNSPQEKDARIYQETYAQVIYNHPNFKPFMHLLDKTCGTAPIIPDRTLSLITHGFTEEEIPGVCLFKNKEGKTFYMHFKQLNLKKWTKKGYKLAWESKELYTQAYNEISRSLTYQDLVY